MRVAIIAALALSACSIPADKVLHMGAGAGVAAVGSGAGLSWQQSCALSAAAGIGKEAYDATGRGTPEAMDAIATAAAGCALAYLIDGMTRAR